MLIWEGNEIIWVIIHSIPNLSQEEGSQTERLAMNHSELIITGYQLY